MRELRVGLVGAGAISRLTAREFAANQRVSLCAVADLNEDRAGQLAAEFGIPVTHTDASALFETPDIEAVYIGVPNRLHGEFAEAALHAGKHVLLDKPFAFDTAQAERVAAIARNADRVFMLGMNQRFTPQIQRARAMVASGALGEVYHAKAFWRRRSGIPRIGSWFTNKAESGGGALLDIGVHMLDATLYALADFDVATVSGAAFTRMGNRGLGDGRWGRSERVHDTFDVDDFTTALIRLRGGAVITLEAAWALHQPAANDMGVVLFGEDAGFDAHGDTVYRYGDKRGEYVITQNPAIEVTDFPGQNRVDHFVNAVLDESCCAVTIDEALMVQRVLDAIYESSVTGREVVF